MTLVAASIQIAKLQPTPQRESHASGEARNVERVSPGHEWSANEGWLDPLRFVLPSSQGNTKMTCYSCAAARNRSMSLIWDNDRSFPDFHISQRGSDWLQNVCVNPLIRTKLNMNSAARAHPLIGGMFWAERYFLIRGKDSIWLCVCVRVCVCICKVSRWRRRRRRGLCWERDWQGPRLKQASRFYNQLRNVDMNRLLLFYTEQRWATSSNYLYFYHIWSSLLSFSLTSAVFQQRVSVIRRPLVHLSASVINPALYKNTCTY